MNRRINIKLINLATIKGDKAILFNNSNKKQFKNDDSNNGMELD